jgi:hypothetical protein
MRHGAVGFGVTATTDTPGYVLANTSNLGSEAF